MTFRQICFVMFLRTSGKVLNTLIISEYVSFDKSFKLFIRN